MEYKLLSAYAPIVALSGIMLTLHSERNAAPSLGFLWRHKGHKFKLFSRLMRKVLNNATSPGNVLFLTRVVIVDCG